MAASEDPSRPERPRGLLHVSRGFYAAPPGQPRVRRATDVLGLAASLLALAGVVAAQPPSALERSFLRFLVFHGELALGLDAAVPIPRQWLHAPLPCRLTVAEVEQVLATCTNGSPAALRNHAILLLLARLGVRAHEVAALCLEDRNWYEGWVRIRPGKTHHERVLPLVQEVGEAVATSLQHGRPATSSRHLFLHCRAPFRPLTDATAISRMAARALRRAGITSSARLGAHPFRHTAASQMVNQGVSFKDVADVLGHRSLQTTGIYAKLDLEAFAAVRATSQIIGGEELDVPK